VRSLVVPAAATLLGSRMWGRFSAATP
jgi:hypothetical protein